MMVHPEARREAYRRGCKQNAWNRPGQPSPAGAISGLLRRDQRRLSRYRYWALRKPGLGIGSARLAVTAVLHGGRCNEPVSHAGDSLYETRSFSVVAEEVTELADGGVNAVFSVDEDPAGPEALGNLVAGDELAFV